MTNVDILTQAGLIKDASQLTPEMQTKINALSSDEITHMISIKAKLGEDDINAHNGVMMI